MKQKIKAKKRTRSEYNAIRRAYGRGFNGNTVSISELIESNRNSSNDNSNIFRHEQEKLDNNDKFDNQKIRAKREIDGRGIAENDNNDNLSEEKYSRDVDYSEYLEFKYDFEKVNQLVFYICCKRKKEPAGSLSPEVSTPPTGSTISISNSLDYVNIILL